RMGPPCKGRATGARQVPPRIKASSLSAMSENGTESSDVTYGKLAIMVGVPPARDARHTVTGSVRSFAIPSTQKSSVGESASATRGPTLVRPAAPSTTMVGVPPASALRRLAFRRGAAEHLMACGRPREKAVGIGGCARAVEQQRGAVDRASERIDGKRGAIAHQLAAGPGPGAVGIRTGTEAGQLEGHAIGGAAPGVDGEPSVSVADDHP